jgi:hypothetical protein
VTVVGRERDIEIDERRCKSVDRLAARFFPIVNESIAAADAPRLPVNRLYDGRLQCFWYVG